MSYLVIARKYRPRKFDDVIGQEGVTDTLKNAIKLERIAHAYLFAGPRGVGKTSVARIFAKALNCKSGPTPDPCGKCPQCAEIDEGRSLDVIEIDGASNRGIDDVRVIRENVKFAPAVGKYKVYIIDEVHQVSTDGFNALLKTLEEPPAHAKFIFATTAPYKVPATVMSRCQRFDFKRIPTKTIVSVLGAVAQKEGLKAGADALLEIAKAADGSLRDGETILDQLSSLKKGELTAADVSAALGSVRFGDFIELFGRIAARDAEGILRFVESSLQDGKEPAYFLEKCLEHVRNLLVAKTAPGLLSVVEGSDAYCADLAKQAALFSKDDLFYFFAVVTQGLQNARRFNSKRVPLEIAFLKCAFREPMVGLEGVAREAAAAPVADAIPKAAPAERSVPAAEAAPVKKNSAPDVSGVSAADIPLEDVWQALVSRVRAEKISAASFLEHGRPVGIQGNSFNIGFSADFAFHADALSSDVNTKLLERHLGELLKPGLRVAFEVAKRVAAAEGAAEAEENGAPGAPPAALKAALGIFGGRVVR